MNEYRGSNTTDRRTEVKHTRDLSSNGLANGLYTWDS